MKTRFILSGLSVAALLAGCGSPDPATLAIEERDKAIYIDAGAEKTVEEVKLPVAVLVSEQNMEGAAKALAPAIDSQLCSVVNDMAFFQLVERSNADALMREQALTSLADDGTIATADFGIQGTEYLITAKVNSLQSNPAVKYMRDKKGNASAISTVTVSLSVDFRFYDLATQKVLVSKDITSKSYSFTSYGETFTEQDNIDRKMARVAKEAVKSFAMELGSRYAPRGRVIETRGDCAVAKVNQGSNYGIVKGVKVEFYEIVDNSAVDPALKRDESIVGRGVVLQSDLRTAWIEVEDYEDVHVKKGDYFKVSSDQSKGFMESMGQQFSETMEDAQSQF